MNKFTLTYLQADNQKYPLEIWLKTLDNGTRKRILQRLLRLEDGNFGDCKQINEELFEIRLKFGSGYRIYFTKIDEIIVLLINGGDKSTQNKDIRKAEDLLKQWRLKND